VGLQEADYWINQVGEQDRESTGYDYFSSHIQRSEHRRQEYGCQQYIERAPVGKVHISLGTNMHLINTSLMVSPL
jgi:hypothetical protein